MTIETADAEARLIDYFTAEKRVDFRALVRDLAGLFRTRIELKQIGVRDEAKRLGGIGRCGREYCSASWLPDLRPVNLQAAKDQKLSLNPSQISGACGRLMCCLRYEHEFYAAARKRFPKEGKIVATSLGEEKIVSNDIFNDRVHLRNAEGEMRTITLVEYKAEVAAAGAGALSAAPVAFEEAYDEGAVAIDAGGDAIIEDEPGSSSLVARPPRVSPPAPEESDRDAAQRRRRRGRRGGKRGGPPEGGAPPAPPAS